MKVGMAAVDISPTSSGVDRRRCLAEGHPSKSSSRASEARQHTWQGGGGGRFITGSGVEWAAGVRLVHGVERGESVGRRGKPKSEKGVGIQIGTWCRESATRSLP